MRQQPYILVVYVAVSFVLLRHSVGERISLFVRVGGICGSTYTQPPASGADFIISPGEPIEVELEIFNEGSQEAVVVTGGRKPRDVFQMVVVEASIAKATPRLSLDVSPSVKLLTFSWINKRSQVQPRIGEGDKETPFPSPCKGQ